MYSSIFFSVFFLVIVSIFRGWTSVFLRDDNLSEAGTNHLVFRRRMAQPASQPFPNAPHPLPSPSLLPDVTAPSHCSPPPVWRLETCGQSAGRLTHITAPPAPVLCLPPSHTLSSGAQVPLWCLGTVMPFLTFMSTVSILLGIYRKGLVLSPTLCASPSWGLPGSFDRVPSTCFCPNIYHISPTHSTTIYCMLPRGKHLAHRGEW